MLVLIGLLVAVAAWLLIPASPAPRLHGIVSGIPAGTRVPALRRMLERRLHGDRERHARDEAVLAALIALVGELRAGLPPTLALLNASTTVWPTAVAAIRLDGDVAQALRHDAVNAPVLRGLAACWQAAASAGSGLADAVERLAAAHREAAEIRGRLRIELAGPRATARMLTGLPLIGIGLGIMLGADPIGFLLGGPAGWACLAAGIALTVVGGWWTGRIAARVEARL